MFILPIFFAGCSEDLKGYLVNENYLKIDKSELSFSVAEISKSIIIESKGSWNITTKPEWLDVSPTSGDGSTTVSLNVADYPQSDAIINGIISLHLDNLTSKIQVSRAPYKFIVPTTELSFGANDESKKELYIRCNTDWTIIKNKSWCHISEESDSNDKTVYVSCDKNNTNEVRRDTLQIRTKLDTILVTIYQSISDYYINPSTPTLVYETDGGSQSFTVDSNTDWTQKLLHGGLGAIIRNGNMLTLTVNKNTSAEERFDTVYIYATNKEIKESAQVYVQQKGLDPVLEVTPDSLKFGSDAGTGNFRIQSNLNWEVTCECEKGDWCHITSDKTGTSNGTVTLSVDQNPLGAEDRDAVVTITTSALTKKVNIHQAPGEKPVLKIIPSTLDTLKYENTGGTNSFTVESNVDWSVTCSDNSWCHIETHEGTGVGTKKVNVTVDLNPAEAPERTCSLIIESSWFNDDMIVIVHQNKGDKGYVRVIINGAETNNLSAIPQGETLTFNIESNLSKWEVSSNHPDWCDVKTTSGSFKGKIELSVGLNSGSDARDATITIKSVISDVTVTVHQEPKDIPGGGDNPDPSYSRKR